MSAPGITPGPWEAFGFTVHVPDKGTVATVQNPWNSETERRANAKAIAAVPAMIEALQELLDIAHGTQDAGPEGEGWKSAELLASIAKAEEALKLAGVQ